VPEDFTMRFNNTYIFIIPEFKDDEQHYVTVILDSVHGGKIEFANIIDNKYIEFSPRDWSDLKDYELQIILTDGNMESVPYKFKLSMTNSAPSFYSKFPKLEKVQLSKEFILPLPQFSDMENNPIMVLILSMPSFMTY
jgi:hypothetical protein